MKNKTDAINIIQSKTGAGQQDCARALEESEGSVVKAVFLLKNRQAAVRAAEQQAAETGSVASAAGLFKKLNLDEFVIDAVIGLFSLFVLFVLLPSGQMLSGRISLGAGVALFLIVDFFLPFYAGRLYRQYEAGIEKYTFIKKIVMAVCSLTILFLFIGFPPQLAKIHKDIEALFPLLYIFGIWFSFCGGLIGFSFPGKIREENRIKDSADAAVLGIALMSPPVLGIVLHALGAFNGVERFFYSQKKGPVAARFIMEKILVPVILVLVMALMQQVYIEGSVLYFQDKDPAALIPRIFFYLCLAGIIPLRFVAGFAPPVKPVNLLTGLISFGLYLFSMHSTILFLLSKNPQLF
ncbi:MAG: hypothetical protein JW904_06560 [Spirochaetales bacterium]|nr:hypothetical protein [Spirochaetales bacterium]